MDFEYRAFMVMPFSNNSVKSAYNHVISPVCEEKSIDIRKADEIFSTNPIYDDIVSEIQKADIIIVDITDKNPNVFYELGMAHTLKQKQTIILTNDEYQEAPFDISHFRILQYEDSIEGKEDFSDRLVNTLDYILKEERLLNEDEFKVIMKTLDAAGKRGQLLTLIGINEIDEKIHQDQPISGEGHLDSNITTFHSINLMAGVKSLIEQDYLKRENEYYFISPKGKAFAEYLKENGYVCDIFNEETLTDDYVPLRERRAQEMNVETGN